MYKSFKRYDKKICEICVISVKIFFVEEWKRLLYDGFVLLFMCRFFTSICGNYLLGDIEMLRKELIKVGLDCKDCTDVLMTLGQSFVDLGVCKASYPQALVDREANYPTALPATAFDIATPHTFAEHVNEPSAGIAILKHPVEWHQMGSPEITLHPEVIFMLAVTDPKQQIGTLRKIMKLIQNSEKLEAVKAAKDADEVYELVKDVFE